MKIDSDLGDAWALFYKFELQHGTEVSGLAPAPALWRAQGRAVGWVAAPSRPFQPEVQVFGPILVAFQHFLNVLVGD